MENLADLLGFALLIFSLLAGAGALLQGASVLSKKNLAGAAIGVALIATPPQTEGRGEERRAQDGGAVGVQDQAQPEGKQEIDDKWTVHEYKILANKDISSFSRSRRRIHILAPTALTREDRIATLVDAAGRIHRRDYPAFIAAFLVGFESQGKALAVGDVIAMGNYASDGCGVSGDDCTGEIWTEMRASDVTFTSEQEAIRQAWFTHEGEFLDANGLPDDTRLVGFLAQKFETTVDHINNQVTAIFLSPFARMEDMELPESLKGKAILTEEELEKREEATTTCRQDLECWGEKHWLTATVACQTLVESMAKYDYEWTDGWPGSKFDKRIWRDRDAGVVSYGGNHVKFQNRFGAWQRMSYWCDYNPDTRAAKLVMFQ